jgi:hypothetical protein
VNNFGPPPQIPLLGQQQKQAEAQIQAVRNSLSLQIYTHLATGYIASRDEYHQIESEYLRSLARASMTAAVSYFEEMLPKKEGETP